MKHRRGGHEPTGRRGGQPGGESIDRAGNADGGQGSEYVDVREPSVGAAEQTEAERSAYWRAHHWTPPAG